MSDLGAVIMMSGVSPCSEGKTLVLGETMHVKLGVISIDVNVETMITNRAAEQGAFI